MAGSQNAIFVYSSVLLTRQVVLQTWNDFLQRCARNLFIFRAFFSCACSPLRHHRPQALLRAHKLDASDPSVFLRTSAFLLGAMVVSTSATSAQAVAPEQLKQLSTASANAAVCRANVAEAVSE